MSLKRTFFFSHFSKNPTKNHMFSVTQIKRLAVKIVIYVDAVVSGFPIKSWIIGVSLGAPQISRRRHYIIHQIVIPYFYHPKKYWYLQYGAVFVLIQMITSEKMKPFFVNCLIFIIFTFSKSHAWMLPSAKFLNDFAVAHDRIAITIYLPENFAGEWVQWHRNSFAK